MAAARLSSGALMVATVLAMATSGCSGGEGSPATTPVSSAAARPSASVGPTSPSPTATTTSTPSSSPSSTPSRTPSPEPAPQQRTAAQLRKALLGLKDIPSGFERDADTAEEESSVTSSDKACASLVRLLNAEALPGSVADAEVSFSGGQEGPFVLESLDAFGSAAAAEDIVRTFRAGVKDCNEVTDVTPGEGKSAFDVRRISFPKLGDDSVAARFRGRTGPLEGFEFTQVVVQSDDVILGMTLIGLDPPDVEAATRSALEKAEDKLGTTESV